MFLRSTYLPLAILLFCIGTIAPAYGQTVPDRAKERAARRAENRANNKLDRSVDKAVDDAFNAVGSLFKKKRKGRPQRTQPVDTTRADAVTTDEAAAGAFLNGLLGGGGGAYEPFTNEVTFSAVMKMTTTKKNGKQEEMQIHLGMLPDKIAQRITSPNGKGDMWSIFNTQTGKVTVITEEKGRKTAMRMRTPNLSGLLERTNTDPDDYMAGITIEATGETKTIDGYPAERYVFTDRAAGTDGETWLTKAIDIDMADMARAMTSFIGGGKGSTDGQGQSYGNYGFPLVTKSTDKKGVRYEQHYTDIKVGAEVDRSLFDIGDTPVTEIPGM